jgi:hypothetical protein
MPAIQVARTDTFEQQRQKINQIGSTLFSITAGGSDLSTGNLKLGDGTRTSPSLAFVSDPGLGIYKSDDNTIGYVSDGKKIADFSPTAFYNFKDFIIRKSVLTSSGLSVLDSGTNYDPGSYTNIPLLGGTGDEATVDITVTEFTGTITNSGSNYIEGSFTNIDLINGSGSGANVSFDIEGIEGFISNNGSGYIPGTYSSVPLTGGSGTGSTANITITGETILSGTITSGGSGYTQNEAGVFPAISLLNTPTDTFVVTTIENPGTPPPDNLYVIDGVTQDVLTLIRGNTYRFDISDASNIGHPIVFETSTGGALSTADYIVIQKGQAGSSGALIDLIIKPTATVGTIRYNCEVHDGMGANINIVSGTAGKYGSGVQANITVNNSGVISAIQFTSSGTGYKQNDTLQIYNGDIEGTGSGFVYTLNTPTYTGEVSNVAIQSNGQNYILGNILSFNSSSVGGFGSGFTFTIDNNPGLIEEITFNSKGTGYLVNDVLELPKSITGVSTNLKSQVSNVSTTLSSSSATITVGSTTGILPNMAVFNSIDDTGELSPGTTVISVNGSTQITLSQTPISSGSANLNFISPGNSLEITVSSAVAQNIIPGSSVIKSSGSGILSSDTTVISVNATSNTVLLSQQPTQAGSVILSFIPPFGDPVNNFEYQISNLGEISSVSISSGGNGYSLLDELTVNPSDLTQPIQYSVSNISVVSVDFVNQIPKTTFTVGNFLKKKDGELLQFDQTTITQTTGTGQVQNFNNISSTTSGSGTGATFNIQRSALGVITSITINSSGYYYSSGDTITISGSLVGGTAPADNIILTATDVSSTQNLEILDIQDDGTNVTSILLSFDSISSGNFLIVPGTTTLGYQVDSASALQYRYFIDLGSGPVLTPNITLYVGNTYRFDLSDNSNSGHIFSLSKYRDGIWGPSLIENIDVTLLTTSNQLTLTNASGILPGMAVTVSSGTGSLVSGTTVQSVVGNVVTLSNNPLSSGNSILTFRGVEYLNGVVRSSDSLTIKITETTPNLYYYCASQGNSHQNEGGEDNQEAVLTINSNNPKVFGSDFSLSVAQLQSSDVITGDIGTGEFTAIKFIGTDAEISTVSVSGSLTSPTITSNSITTSSISSSTNLSVTSSNVNITGNLNVGTNVQITNSSGNITTSGILKTTNSLNINDILSITNNTISSAAGNNILLSPGTGRVTKINATSAITIPSGTTAQRPAAGVVESGSIRFNTDTNQYEGYSGTTSSWSSLGGVRDLDGNTYITAEQTIGSNDNRLWFYNDNINTVRFTTEYQEFINVKKVRSLNLSAPLNVNWTASTPVTTGQYLKYRNNIYEVVTGGTTGTSGNEPTNTTGNNFANGTATLRYSISAVAPLTFEEISELRVAPDGGTSLVINGDLRLQTNEISTDINDLKLRPNTGKKVTIDAATSLVLPVGNINERGAPIQGSVRFNTTISQYEGYDGTNWSSLGGVRDVDGNTYIIPELSAGSNENILYFYNNGSNTLRVTANDIQLDTIDTITSDTSNTLNLDASLITFNNLAVSIDTSSSTNAFISTTKDNLDLGLSSGLTNDPLLRLSDTGDIYYNLGFGTGVYNGIKVFDSELKELEIADYKISTTNVTLTRGTVNSGNTVLYDPALHASSKVQIIAHNETTGDKEFIEYSVIDKGTDIFFTDFGNVKTGAELISCVFDFNASNNVRVTFTLNTSLSTGNVVKVTVISNIIKR